MPNIMPFITGVITQTADDTCVVSVTMDVTQRLFSFSKTIFYTFGVKCAGSMANILEEGMEVDLCYNISHPGRKPYVLSVWCGDRPDVIEDSAFVNLYDQGGRVSYYVDDENFVVQNDAGNYTVIISTGAAFRDGLRLKDIGATVTMDESVQYDAIPFDSEHSSGASYQATCAWVGRKAPGLVDRFHLQSMENCNVDGELANNDVHGIVVTIPNDVVAVVEGLFKSDVVKVLLLRSSFGVECDSIRDVVDVGDHVSMRIGYRCMFSGRKQFFAVEALKLCEEVGSLPKNDVLVPVITQNCVTEVGLVRRNDVTVPVEAEMSVAESKDTAGYDVTDVTKDINCVKEANVGVTKHFNRVRSVKSDVKRKTVEKAGNVTEVAVRNYVGLGVKSVKSNDSVKEVIEVANVISTYSAVLQDGSNGKTAGKAVTNVMDSIRKNPSPDLKSSANKPKNGCVEANVISSKPFMPCSMKPFASVKTGNVTGLSIDAKQAKSGAENALSVVAEGAVKLRETDCIDIYFAELNRELDIANNNDVTVIYTQSFFNSKLVAFVGDSVMSSDPRVLYCDPPLTGVMSRFSLDCGCITFKHFKVFVNSDNFYVDGILCSVKHFVKFAKARKCMVNFEAVTRAVNSEFTHEATCAWVGNKPSLLAIRSYLPPPKFSLIALQGQEFCGVVLKLYLPEYALVGIHGGTTVVVHVSSFVIKPQYADGSLGKLITNYVKLNEKLVFKLKQIDSEPKLLGAWDIRTAEHLTSKQPAAAS